MRRAPEPDGDEAASKRGAWYAAIPVGLIVASLLGNVFMMRIATADPAFAVERDYYKKAVLWDQEMAQAELNHALGYSFRLETRASGGDVELSVVLLDAAGKPIELAVISGEAFSNARAGDITKLAFSDEGPVHRTKLSHPRPGLWELRLEATVAGRRFTAVERRDLGG
ncbi:MAG: FixH family protein [Deltaproteobacteria bacterium]|nr:FixH family protein [Deltaproteobacteria bacterium]